MQCSTSSLCSEFYLSVSYSQQHCHIWLFIYIFADFHFCRFSQLGSTIPLLVYKKSTLIMCILSTHHNSAVWFVHHLDFIILLFFDASWIQIDPFIYCCTWDVTFETFFCLAFPATQSLQGFKVHLVISIHNCLAVFLVHSSKICLKTSWAVLVLIITIFFSFIMSSSYQEDPHSSQTLLSLITLLQYNWPLE